MNIEILYEDENYLAIYKPSGLVVHADGKTNEKTVVDWILEKYPEIQGIGENMIVDGKEGSKIILQRPGIVHRIDRDTSGCLIIAKNQNAFNHLKRQFQEHKVKKVYQAIVYGNIKQDSGVIEAPIGKHRSDFRMKDAGKHARGTLREATTNFLVIDRYEHPTKRDKQKQTLKYTFVELRPMTGRTHQIRVHLKYLQNPIVSDSLYAGKRKPELGIERTALHARSISFIGMNEKVISVEAHLPEDMKQALGMIQKI